jgi:hypothetical protein
MKRSLTFVVALSLPLAAAAGEDLARQARRAMDRSAGFFQSIAVHGGYAGIYSLDLQLRWASFKSRLGPVSKNCRLFLVSPK